MDSSIYETISRVTGEAQPNMDVSNGIRYGIIPANSEYLNQEAISDITINGDNVDYEDFVKDIKDRLALNIAGALDLPDDDEMVKQASEGAFEAISERISDGYDGDNDTYVLNEAGYSLMIDSSNDVWVFKSPYYTLCGLCSPCAPNAGYLTTPGNYKAYCLGIAWMEDENNIPYDIYDVETNELVVKATKQGER